MARSGSRLGTSTSRLGSLRLGDPSEGFTAQLGIEESRPGNIVLGLGSRTGTTVGPLDTLGPAVLFAPTRIDQEVRPGLLGGAVLYTPLHITGHVRVTQRPVEVAYTPSGRQIRVTQRVVEVAYRFGVWPDLLGGATVFSPTISFEGAAGPMALLGPAQLFTPTVVAAQTVGPMDLLGPAVTFAPRIDQQVQIPLLGPSVLLSPIVGPPGVLPALLGPAVIFAPSIGQEVPPGLLGPAVLYSPIVGPPGVLPDLLGPAQIFAPTLTGTQSVFPDLLGPAVLYAPLVGPPGVLPSLLGPAQTFAPTVNQAVLFDLLGPAVLFAPTIESAAVYPPLIGPSSLYTPLITRDETLSGSDTGSGTDNATTDTARQTADNGVGVDDAFIDQPQPSESGVGTDVASVVKLGDSLCGPYSGPVTITYDGTDITSCVLYEQTTFQSAANGAPGSAQVRIKDAGQDLEFITGKPLTLTVEGTREWTGFVSGVRRGYFFNGSPDAPGDTVRYFLLDGVGINVLFQKRILYDKENPATQIQLTEFDPRFESVADDVIIKYYMDHHMDLAADGISQAGVENVGDISIDAKVGRTAGETWGSATRAFRFLTGAVDYIDPDKVYHHVDVETPNAPFDVTDDPVGGPEHGVRELEIHHNGEKLRNDALVWGAGQGSDVVVFHRTIDDDSVTEHGLWQVGQFLTTVWRQATVDRIADSWVYGSPQNKRGGKDDQVLVTFTTFEPGLRVAQKINVRSAVYDFERVLPIRSIAIDFPVPMHPRYRVGCSDEIDDPFSTFEFWWPDFHFDPPVLPRIPALPSWQHCGDNFNRATEGWGVASGMGGAEWFESSNVGNPSDVLMYTGGGYGTFEIPGPGLDGDNGASQSIITDNPIWQSFPIHIRLKVILDHYNSMTWANFSDVFSGNGGLNINMGISGDSGTDGDLLVNISASDGTETAFGDLTPITDFTRQSFYVAIYVTADTIKGKLWPVGLPEPAAWTTFTNPAMDLTPVAPTWDRVNIGVVGGVDDTPSDYHDFSSIDEMAFLQGSNCGGTTGTAVWFGNHDVVETDTPPGYPSGYHYYITPFIFAPNTERVWLDRRIMRRDIDYIAYPLAGFIAINDSFDVTGKTITVNFVATGPNFATVA